MRRARYRATATGTIPGCPTHRPPPPCSARGRAPRRRSVAWGRPGPGSRSRACSSSSCPRRADRADRADPGRQVDRARADTPLDGARPTSSALAARLASFWLPSQIVLYIGATTCDDRRRAGGHRSGPTLGDRRPHAGGHWLQDPPVLPSTRVWWAATEASRSTRTRCCRPSPDGLPRTNWPASPTAGRAAVGEPAPADRRAPRATGLAAHCCPRTRPRRRPRPVVVLPDGDAEGARGEPRGRRSARDPRRGPRCGRRPRAAAARHGDFDRRPRARSGLQAELGELTEVRRPEVIARIRAAKELGDLKENADYHAAREEQSFLEGRIQALEARLRDAVIAEAPAAGEGADIGSTSTVEVDGGERSTRSSGRPRPISPPGASPWRRRSGRALVGARTGDEVAVETPRGDLSGAQGRVARVAW